LSYQAKTDLVAAALRKPNPDGAVYIRDLYDVDVVYVEGEVLMRRSYSIDPVTQVVTLGQAERVAEDRVYVPVQVGFSRSEGDTDIYRGKLFEAGDFPDKGISFTEAELAELVKGVDVFNNLEHTPTVLDKKLGRTHSMFMKGSEVHGTVEIPSALRTLINSKTLKTSFEFDRKTKRIIGNAIVMNPRITDAQVVAAFSAPPEASRKGPVMDVIAKMKALLSGVSDDGVTPVVTPTFSVDPEVARLKAENTRLLQQQADGEAARIKAAAATFADDALNANKITPALRDSVVILFGHAVRDDNAGKACFSATGDIIVGERVAALKALVAALPPHSLTTEQIPGKAVFAGDVAKPASTIDTAAIYAGYNNPGGKK
jgi:hypothetical protein